MAVAAFVLALIALVLGIYKFLGKPERQILSEKKGSLLKEKLKKFTSVLRLYFRWVLPAGPVLVVLGIIYIIVEIPLLFFTPATFMGGIVFLIIFLIERELSFSSPLWSFLLL